MKYLRVPMIILASLHLAFAGLTGMVGLFADGGTVPERILASVVHPVAAILLLVAVASSKSLSKGLRGFTLALLLFGIAADLVLALLIGQGAIKGDWSLALVFAVVPTIGLVYLTTPTTKTV